MKSCRRFEKEGAGFLEHLRDCETCRSARSEYEGVQRSLASLGESYRAPDGWKERVRAGVSGSESAQETSLWERFRTWARAVSARGRPRRFAALAVSSVFVLAVALFLARESVLFPRPATPSLEQTIRAGTASARRGLGEAGLGDQLVLEAETGGAAYGELRVYLNDAPLLRVPASDEGKVELVLNLSVVGSYEPVLVVSDVPIPPPESTLDADAGAAFAAGARVELGEEVRIR